MALNKGEHFIVLDIATKAVLFSTYDANSSAIEGQWYWASDEDNYYLGGSDGKLKGPIPMSPSTVNGFNSTDTIHNWTSDVNGDWSADVRIDSASDNIISSSAAGIKVTRYIKSIGDTNSIDLAVDGSGELTSNLNITNSGNNVTLGIGASGLGANVDPADLISSDAGNDIVAGTDGKLLLSEFIKSVGNSSSVDLTVNGSGKLTAEVKSIAISKVTVVTTSVNSITWLDSNGGAMDEGDVVIFTDSTDGDGYLSYIHNGGTSGTASNNFTLLDTDHIDDTHIRSLFSAGDSLTYNSSTGEFDLVLAGAQSGVANDLSLVGVGNDIYISVRNTDVADTESLTGGGDQPLQDLLDALSDAVGNNLTGLTPDRVVYVGSGGELAIDSKFQYKTTNTSGSSKETLLLNGANLEFGSKNDNIIVVGDDNTTKFKLWFKSYGAMVSEEL